MSKNRDLGVKIKGHIFSEKETSEDSAALCDIWDNIYNTPTKTFTLGPGESELRSGYETEVDYSTVTIKKLSNTCWITPSHTFIERLKYLFTGKLPNVETVKQYMERNKD